MPEYLTNQDIRELLEILNIALYDADTATQQSHDIEEVAALREHRATIRTWITRLSRAIGRKPESEAGA